MSVARCQGLAVLLLFATVGAARPCAGQAGEFVEVDATPLARLQAVCSRGDTKADVVKAGISDVLAKEGFQEQGAPDARSWDAVRYDAKGAEAHDRVLIWLERDFERPDDTFHVYLLFGRYRPVKVAGEPVSRVKLTPAEEFKRSGSLRRALVLFCRG